MMQSMRNNMKVVIWLTAIAFLVGFGVLQLGGVLNPPKAGGPAGVIAKINGEAIRYEDFMRTYNNIVNQIRQTRELRQGEDSYIRQQAWQEMVQAKLLEQEVRRRGITATPEEIKSSIRFSPPQFVTQAPAFQTNGSFDYRKYVTELDNPNSAVPWAQLEEYVAQTLPQQKLQDVIVQSVKVSEADVRDRFLQSNEKLKVRYVYFPADSFAVDTSRIGGADIETYYKSHPEEFTGPAETKLQVALVARQPKDPDFAVVRERLQGIRDQIAAQPDSFMSFARAYSEILSAQSGGDAPDIEYLQIRPAFQAALKLVQPGQLSEIVREERSLHLFRIDKRWRDPVTQREKIHYHEIALRVEPGPETVAQVRKQVEEVLGETRREGLVKVATRRGLRTTETGYFAEGQSGNDIFQRFPEIETWAFSAKTGAVSRPVPTENGWYIYQILDRRAAGVRSLGQTRIFVREQLVRSLEIAKAKQTAEDAHAAIVGGMKDEDTAKKFHARSGTTSDVMRSGLFAPIGVEPKVVGALLAMPVGSWSAALEGTDGAFVCYVEEHTRPNEDEYRKQADQSRETLLNQLRQAHFSEWMQRLRKKAKIQDFRENYFEV